MKNAPPPNSNIKRGSLQTAPEALTKKFSMSAIVISLSPSKILVKNLIILLMVFLVFRKHNLKRIRDDNYPLNYYERCQFF